MLVEVPAFIATTLGFAVFVGGSMLNGRFKVLQEFNIPEPVTGGLLAALVAWLLFAVAGIELSFDLQARDIFLVLFFAGIGLNARVADLLSGGLPLLLLLVLTVLMIILQNGIGVIGALIFDFPFQIGVLFGSAALIGGHGTAIAWSPEVIEVTGFAGASELGVAVATLGLVLAALVGGPIAKYLVEGRNLTPDRPASGPAVGVPHSDNIDDISPLNVMRVLFYVSLSVVLGYALSLGIEQTGLKLPLFVPCLIVGIFLANLRSFLFPSAPAVSQTPSLALISEVCLGAFLAMSLMSLQLWTIAALGPAILAILAAQTLIAVAFILFVLFPVMGGGYRAAVLGAGFGGFALGATPTAIANMTAVTKRYGPSPMAFVILPLVSAFFVDLANALVIQTIVTF